MANAPPGMPSRAHPGGERQAEEDAGDDCGLVAQRAAGPEGAFGCQRAGARCDDDEQRADAEEPETCRDDWHQCTDDVPHDGGDGVGSVNERRGADLELTLLPTGTGLGASMTGGLRLSALLLRKNSCASGMFAGHTNEHDPHSMQSDRCSCGISSYRPARASSPSACGLRNIGQASRQRPQWMHGYVAPTRVSRSVSTTTRSSLRIGTSSVACDAPIIGPPKTISLASSVTPPHISSRSRSFVPIGTMRLAGFLTPRPDTVTMRSTSGSPVSKISPMDAARADVLHESADAHVRLAGFDLEASHGLDQHLLGALRILHRKREDSDIEIVRRCAPQRFDRVGLVPLDTDDRAARSQRVEHDAEPEPHALGVFDHDAMVGRQVRLALGAVEDDRVDLEVRWRRELHVRRERGASRPTTPPFCTAATIC